MHFYWLQPKTAKPFVSLASEISFFVFKMFLKTPFNNISQHYGLFSLEQKSTETFQINHFTHILVAAGKLENAIHPSCQTRPMSDIFMLGNLENDEK